MGQVGDCSLGIDHLNLSQDVYAFCDNHVLKVLMCTAACNNSCVAVGTYGIYM